jgi:hypothetical protein
MEDFDFFWFYKAAFLEAVMGNSSFNNRLPRYPVSFFGTGAHL